jgi:hypothetical protein
MPTTKRDRNDFINFIIDSDNDQQLVDEFNQITNALNLYNWFRTHGYIDIPAHDCDDILAARGIIRGRKVPDAGQTAQGACVPGGKAY